MFISFRYPPLNLALTEDRCADLNCKIFIDILTMRYQCFNSLTVVYDLTANGCVLNLY